MVIQGWVYSAALSADDLIQFITDRKEARSSLLFEVAWPFGGTSIGRPRTGLYQQRSHYLSWARGVSNEITA